MFSESAESDVLWWGKEGATKRKDLCLLRGRVQQRIRNSSDMTEVAELKLGERKLNVMVSLVESAQRKGAGSAGFMSDFEVQVSILNLANPPLDLTLPPWLHHRRHNQSIAESASLDRWISRVDAQELSRHGCTDVPKEQDH